MTNPAKGSYRSNNSSPASGSPTPSRRGSTTERVAKKTLSEEKKQAHGQSYAYPKGKITKVVKVIKGGTVLSLQRSESGTTAAPVDDFLAELEAGQKKLVEFRKAQAKQTSQTSPRGRVPQPLSDAQRSSSRGDLEPPKIPVRTQPPHPILRTPSYVPPARVVEGPENAVPRIEDLNLPPNVKRVYSKSEQSEGMEEDPLLGGEETYMFSNRTESPSDTLVLSPRNQKSSPRGELADETLTMTPGAESTSPIGEQTEGVEGEEIPTPRRESLHLPPSQPIPSPRREYFQPSDSQPPLSLNPATPQLDLPPSSRTQEKSAPPPMEFPHFLPPSQPPLSSNPATPQLDLPPSSRTQEKSAPPPMEFPHFLPPSQPSLSSNPATPQLDLPPSSRKQESATPGLEFPHSLSLSQPRPWPRNPALAQTGPLHSLPPSQPILPEMALPPLSLQIQPNGEDAGYAAAVKAMADQAIEEARKAHFALNPEVARRWNEAQKKKSDDLHMVQPEISLDEEPEPSPLFLGNTVDERILEFLLNSETEAFNIDESSDGSLLRKSTPIFKMTEVERNRKTKLNFSNSKITDDQLNFVLRYFPNISEARLSSCHFLTTKSLSVLSRMVNPRALSIRSCPGIEIEEITEQFPIGQLEDFSLSTEKPIPQKLTQELAKSKKIKRVSFNDCLQFGPEALYDFKDAVQEEEFEISLFGTSIPEETAEEFEKELNENRGDQPIRLQFAKPEESTDRFSGAIDPAKENNVAKRRWLPPEIEEDDDILSRNTVKKMFTISSGQLPHSSAIEGFDFIFKPKHKGEKPRPLRGIKLVGDAPSEEINDSLNALAKKCPDVTIISIFNSALLSGLGSISLRQFLKAKILYLAELPGLTAKMIVTMLSDNPQTKSWQEVEEIFLAGLPVTDEALHLISHFPRLKRLDISGCNDFTAQGLYHFLRRCPTLESLTILDCPSIDRYIVEEFEGARPNVLISDKTIDRSAIELAIEEADARIFLRKESLFFDFIGDILGREDLIPVTQKIETDEPEKITSFYMDQFKMLGIDIPFQKDRDPQEQWIRFDQILQAYINISRVARALLKEIKRVSFFTNVENKKPPNTVRDIIALLNVRNEKEERYFLKKVQKLDFSDLAISFLPHFIEKEEWPQLTHINLQGTFVHHLSKEFKKRCTRLEVIEYPDHQVEALPGFSDDSFKEISCLNEMKKFTISHSDLFTVRGLQTLMKCPSLTEVSIQQCRSIDVLAIEEFGQKCPEVKVNVNIRMYEESAQQLAMAEANRRMLDRTIQREFVFHRDFTKAEIPLPENVKETFVIHKAIQSYTAQLAGLGIKEEINPKDKNVMSRLMRCDQTIQAYHNFTRIVREIERELFRNHAFANLDERKAEEVEILRQSVEGVIQLLDIDCESHEDVMRSLKVIAKDENEIGQTAVHIAQLQKFSDKVQNLNFSNLGITFIPKALEIEWKNVKTIDLSGTAISQIPESFKKNCPSLLRIHYTDRTEIVRLAPSIELTPLTIKELNNLKNPHEAIRLLNMKNQRKESYCDQITSLDFSGLEGEIPDYILRTKWKNVTAINLRNTSYYEVPEQLKKQCPKLELAKCQFPEKMEEALPPPPLEEKKEDTPPPPKMSIWDKMWSRRTAKKE